MTIEADRPVAEDLTMGSPADVHDLGLPRAAQAAPQPAPPDHASFIELLTKVGCHVYSGEVQPDGRYRETYSGPGIEMFLGGVPDPGADLTEMWNEAVHPDDLDAYLCAGTLDTTGVMELEYRMIGLDGVTRWVLDQMWLREERVDGVRLIDGVVTDITSRKQAELQLRELAHSDSLTGLANRLDVGNRIDAAVSALSDASPGIALLLLDLDGFKAVNDSLGHATGDELLLMVARRLRACLRPTDVAARLGGDEFAVLLEDVDHAQAMVVAERVLDAIALPFALKRSTVAVSASIGLVNARDERGNQDLLRDADVAMYRAKAEGKNRIVTFEPAMQEKILSQLQLEAELRSSIDDCDFVLHYQPMVDIHSGVTVGVEALVRWQHPTRGMLPPSEFIALAEDTGLIVPLGRWVLTQACSDAASWQPRGEPPLSVSVNLSPRQLHDPDLIEATSAALLDAGLPAQALVIEITENLLMNDAQLATTKLAALRGLGVRVAVDDFGTGYSSLAYLDRYPVDILKIDRSFVDPLGTSPRSAALVRSIIDLATALEIEAVAEGVEVARQAAELQSLGCRLAQGYYFSHPEPADKVRALLRAQRLA